MLRKIKNKNIITLISKCLEIIKKKKRLMVNNLLIDHKIIKKVTPDIIKFIQSNTFIIPSKTFKNMNNKEALDNILFNFDRDTIFHIYFFYIFWEVLYIFRIKCPQFSLHELLKLLVKIINHLEKKNSHEELKRKLIFYKLISNFCKTVFTILTFFTVVKKWIYNLLLDFKVIPSFLLKSRIWIILCYFYYVFKRTRRRNFIIKKFWEEYFTPFIIYESKNLFKKLSNY